MARILTTFSRLVTARPYVTILVLLIATVALAAGAQFRAPPPETRATLPPDSPVTHALAEIDRLFGDSGAASVVTLIFRGQTLTPGGLAQMDALVNDIVSEPDVASLLAPDDPVVAPSALVKALLQTDNLASVTQAQIDAADGPPEILGALAALTGTDEASPSPPSACAIRATSASRKPSARFTGSPPKTTACCASEASPPSSPRTPTREPRKRRWRLS
ncbi:MAG: hypothetical protein J4F32_02770 [Dehalococcoidia bacterium]|nr:hypothetical protein [Dehalococcoidia bacterium]